MLMKTEKNDCAYVSNYPQRITSLTCPNCKAVFLLDISEHHQCPDCTYDYCDTCDSWWDGSEYDQCQEYHCNHEEPDNYRYKQYTLPGSSLTYWA